MLEGLRAWKAALTALLFAAAAGAAAETPPRGPQSRVLDRVAGNLILFNDNGAWCWYQDPRVLIDSTNGTMLIGSIASPAGPDGERRRGNVELTRFEPASGSRETFVLDERFEADDHDVPALFLRPDGRYLAMYAKHNRDSFSHWRISTRPHDASSWTEKRSFDWSKPTGRSRATYSNLHYLPAEKRLYNFVRAINDDPSIMVSSDHGETWSYGGKLLTIEKLGYVNGYCRYASNGVDRIDFITTEHHPRDFNNSIFHGAIKGGKLLRSDGSVVDENVLDPNGRPQTELTKIFAAGSVVGGETMTRAWTADLRLDERGSPVAIITCRANDVPANSNFNDHRFFYLRFDGTGWRSDPLAKAGPRLWDSEQDYTGLGALNPHDTSVVYISTPIDPRDGSKLDHHEIFKGATSDAGSSWKWSAVTEGSAVDNLRPIVPLWDRSHTAVLWFRGTMTRSQRYDTAVVGIVETSNERVQGVAFSPAAGRGSKTQPSAHAGIHDVFAFFRGNPAGDATLRAGLSSERAIRFRQRACQRAEPGQFEPATIPAEIAEPAGLYRAAIGRMSLREGACVEVFVDPGSTSFVGAGVAPVR